VIVDEELGLCPQIKPPGTAQFYPSLAYWLAQRRQRRETLGEEMRLLYVALTRAMEWLILAGTVPEKRMEEKWPQWAEALSTAEGVLRCHSYLDWIGGWLTAPENLNSPSAPKVIVHHEEVPGEGRESEEADAAEDIGPEIRSRMDWSYPFAAATAQAAKTSVSALRRQSAALDDEEAAVWFGSRRLNGLDASEIGSAHHLFLEAVSLEKLGARPCLAEEAERLRREGRLSAAQTASLDLEALASFWESETGRQLLGQSRYLRRELAFTARFGGHELPSQTLSNPGQKLGEQEFVVVQGAVDLAAILPAEIWIVDFKTDQFAAGDLSDKIKRYRPQLGLYGAALARIYRRPVTKSWLCFLGQREVVLL
jgi:ATP-dependent helicase/nuclease subunit A